MFVTAMTSAAVSPYLRTQKTGLRVDVDNVAGRCWDMEAWNTARSVEMERGAWEAGAQVGVYRCIRRRQQTFCRLRFRYPELAGCHTELLERSEAIPKAYQLPKALSHVAHRSPDPYRRGLASRQILFRNKQQRGRARRSRPGWGCRSSSSRGSRSMRK